MAHKDLTVAGTKDKRAITYQRVSLRRGKLTREIAWKMLNGVSKRNLTEAEAVSKRGDRGCRAGDFSYENESLELGYLKGNRFEIALR